MARVRTVVLDDLERLLDCERSVLGSLRGILPDDFVEEELGRLEPGEEEALKRFIEHPDSIVLIAEEEERVVGFALGNVRGGVGRLGFMGVRPEYRRRGIGSSLLEEYIERSRQRGAHKVWLWTQTALKPAIRLYVRAGFLPEGFLRRHSYGMDMVIYSKFLE